MATTKSHYQKAVEEYNASDKEYKQHLQQYEVALLTAELAVIGFLLQNAATRKLISGWYFKGTLELSLLTTFAAIVCIVLYKRNEAQLNRESMHVEYYQMFADQPGLKAVALGVELSALKDLRAEQNKHRRNAVEYYKNMVTLLNYSEKLFVAGVLFAILFVTTLIAVL